MEIIPPRKLGPRPPDSLPEPKPQPPKPAPQASAPPAADDNSSVKSIVSTIALFATAFSIAILLNTFVIQSYQVDGQSMQNTLQNNDRLIVNKVPRTISRLSGHQYVPRRGEIIIFNQSGLPGFIGEKQLIKRVIGLPGERVVVNNGKITIYNSARPNGFNPDTTTGYHIDAAQTIGNVDIRLQSNEIFVCGDNRNNSEDSRYFGPITTNQIVAKLVLRILPFDKAQSF
jgi:signal peptidase I